jgi:ubiquinone biosynthesis protein COQ9
MTDTLLEMQDIRDRVVTAVLPHVPFEGWSAKALRLAAVDAGFDPTMGERAFPGGAVAAVEHFAQMADRQLERDAAGAKFDDLRTPDRIAWLVKQRLLPWAEHREAIRRALTLLSLPSNADVALRATWRTVDSLWYAAGDGATDFSFYTKRVTLAAIYSATLFYWLEDGSEDFEDSWSFLHRRIEDAGRLPKLRRDLQKRLENLPNLLALLSGLQRQKRPRFGVRG